MILVTSSAYIGQEFRAEFGALPPCMLPIGNRRLYQHQIDSLAAAFPDERLYVSLPDDFSVPEVDRAWLDAAAAEVVGVPDGLTLAEAVLYVINSIGKYDDTLRILHGDTLIMDMPAGLDVVTISETYNDYNWEVEAVGASDETVWSGFFSFSDIRRFARALALSQRDFVSAVRAYDAGLTLGKVSVSQWLDLGHVNTYYVSRAKMTTERAFNDLHISGGVVRKSGQDASKIEAEVHWYKNVPAAVRRYCPQLLESGVDQARSFYTLEYLHLSPLNELYVHGRNPHFFWDYVFSRIDAFLNVCMAVDGALDQYPRVSADAEGLFCTKTRERLESFSRQNGFDIDVGTELNGIALPSLRAVAERCMLLARDGGVIPGIMHGDLCFSNLLFDGRAGDIKVIDPRGLNQQGEPTIYGDLRYDLAKLMHSVIGLYDFIVADAVCLRQVKGSAFLLDVPVDARIRSIQKVFLEKEFLGGRISVRDLYPHTILLFLSMLPLHADNPRRQMAFVANALRLYSDMGLVK